MNLLRSSLFDLTKDLSNIYILKLFICTFQLRARELTFYGNKECLLILLALGNK